MAKLWSVYMCAKRRPVGPWERVTVFDSRKKAIDWARGVKSRNPTWLVVAVSPGGTDLVNINGRASNPKQLKLPFPTELEQAAARRQAVPKKKSKPTELKPEDFDADEWADIIAEPPSGKSMAYDNGWNHARRYARRYGEIASAKAAYAQAKRQDPKFFTGGRKYDDEDWRKGWGRWADEAHFELRKGKAKPLPDMTPNFRSWSDFSPGIRIPRSGNPTRRGELDKERLARELDWLMHRRRMQRHKEEAAEARALREAELDRIRSWCAEQRGALQQSCTSKRKRTRAVARDAIEAAREARRQARADYSEIVRARRESKARRKVSKRDRIARVTEGDDLVRANIPPELVPLWEKVKRSIKGTAHRSRTEAFLHYAEEHPSEVWEASEQAMPSSAEFAADYEAWAMANPSSPPPLAMLLEAA